MPRPWRPPMALASIDERRPGRRTRAPLIATGQPSSKRTVTSSASIVDVGSPVGDAHDRLDDLHPGRQLLERLGLVGGAPDVGVGRVRLLLRVAVRQAAGDEELAHLGPPAELVDELLVEPRLVDPQRRVDEQAVAVEALDVVALVGAAVAPDVDAVVVHRPHEQRAGDGPPERRGVEVRPAGGRDVERAALQRHQALADELGAAVDEAGRLGAVLPWPGRARRRGRARRTGRGRRCRRRGSAPCSRIQATAADVSSPPEKAMPTRSPTGSDVRTLRHGGEATEPRRRRSLPSAATAVGDRAVHAAEAGDRRPTRRGDGDARARRGRAGGRGRGRRCRWRRRRRRRRGRTTAGAGRC